VGKKQFRKALHKFFDYDCRLCRFGSGFQWNGRIYFGDFKAQGVQDSGHYVEPYDADGY